MRLSEAKNVNSLESFEISGYKQHVEESFSSANQP
jgi:hypothetical protein